MYGISGDTDSYYLALIVQAALGISLSEALYAAFLPAFTERGRPDRRLLRRALTLSLPLTAAVAVVYTALVLLLDPAHRAVWLAFAPTLLFGPLTTVYAAYLTADRRYTLAIMRVPLITAVALVVIATLLPFWRSITALAVAVNVGQLLVLAFLALRERSSRPPIRDRPTEPIAVPAYLHAVGSVFVATLLTGPLIVLVERSLAATLATGAVTLLVNARGFVLVPAMVSQALGSGVFPAATERFKVLGGRGLADLTLVAIRLGVLAALVAGVYVVLCRRELIEIALRHGNFTADDASKTARLVAIMAPSLLGIAASSVAGKALYGVGRQRLVAAVSTGAVACYGAAALALREPWGVDGLAAAFAISAILGGGVLAGALAREVGLRLRTVLWQWIVAPGGLAIAFGVSAGGAWLASEQAAGDGWLPALAVAFGSGLAGLAALAAAAFVTGARELELLRSRLAGRRQATEPAAKRSAEAPG